MPLVRQEYFQYRVADVLSRLFSRRFAYWLALRVAHGCYRGDAVGRAAVVANLRQVLSYRGEDTAEARLDGLARETFRNFAKYLVDFFRFTGPLAGELHGLLSVRGEEHFHAARALDRGVIVVSAHLGNYDLGSAHLAGQGYTIKTVALALGDGRTNRLFQQRRRARGAAVAPLGQAGRMLMVTLKRKGLVALLADRELGTRRDLTPLFGRPAALPMGPARLAARMGVPVLPAFVLRQPDDTFVMDWHAPILPQAAATAEAIEHGICRALETAIGPAPTQWFAFRRIWPE
jgi:lauroyl/myristoyl acyltransferase